MGNWLKINGDAIYGTRFWKESGQKEGHLAFTTKGQNLYAIALEKPKNPIIIKGTKGWSIKNVQSIELLGSEVKILWKIAEEGLEIIPPKNLGKSEYAWTFKILTNQNQHHPNAVELNAGKVFNGTKKVHLEGF